MNAAARAWSRLPRTLKWAALALVAAVLYFLAVEPVLDITGSFRSRADAIANAQQRAKDLGSPDSEDGRLLAAAERLFGKPTYPDSPEARPDALYRAVNRILRENFIEDAVVTEKNEPLQLRPEQQALLTGGLRSIERFALEVAFESDPDTALAVLTAMEAAPEITAVGRVSFEKFGTRSSGPVHEDDQTVRVRFSPEIWVATFGSGGGGGAGGSPL